MHNITSNTDPSKDITDWANRFVPLPPTEFPPLTAGIHPADIHHGQGSPTGAVSDSPVAEANLPCLQAIAGVDPFFTPSDNSAITAPAISSPLMTSTPPPTTPAPSFSTVNPNPERDSALRSPAVEIIGQHSDPTSVVTEKNIEVETPLQQEKPEVQTMNELSLDQLAVGIHEYDRVLKVLPGDYAGTGSQRTSEPVDVATNEAASHDASAYWSQGNVSSFVPGVTPIGAYPVCREFVDQVMVSADTKLAPIEEVCAVAAEETNAAEGSPEPMQVDPFATDEFESVQEVTSIKSGNQLSQMAPVPQAAPAVVSEPQSMQQVAPVGVGDDQPASDQVASEAVELNSEVAEETFEANEAAPSPIASAESTSLDQQPYDPSPAGAQSAATPLDVTQAIPQMPNNGFASPPPTSQQLFESVEQSLNDLQSINQMDLQQAFAPATNALVESPVQPEPAIEAVVEEPAPVVEPVETDVPAGLVRTASGYAVVTEPVAVAELAISGGNPSATVEQPALVQLTAIAEAAVAEPPVVADTSARWGALDPGTIGHANFSAFSPVDLTAELPSVPSVVPPVPQPATAAAEVLSPVTNTEVAEPFQAETARAEFVQTEASVDDEAQVPVQSQSSDVEQAPVEDSGPAGPAQNGTCQVIEVDGDDGYDSLDLKAFDASHAIFTPGIIFIDDGTNKFQIEYRNLTVAVFAGDFQVELS